MRFRPFRRWFLPVVILLVAIRCGGDSLTVPSEGLPAKIVLIGGDLQGGVVGQRVTDTLSVKVTDSKDRVVRDWPVAFQLVAGGTGAVLIPDTARTDANGIAKSVWVLGSIAGQQRVEAKVVGNGLPAGLKVSFTANAVADAPDTVFAVKGQGQAGIVSQALTDSLAVVVTDRFGNPIAGQVVQWSVPVGQGSVSALADTTGADGRAAVARTLGPTAGPQTATATRAGLKGNPVTFTSTASPGGASKLVKLFGDTTVSVHQVAPAGQRLTDSLVVQTQDATGNGVAGQSVVWTVTSGGGSVSSPSSITDAQGKAFVFLTLGTTVGQNTVRVTSPGLTPVDFSANGIAAQASKLVINSSASQSGFAGSPVTFPPSVKVTDSNNNPVQGVTVTFTVQTGAGIVSDGTGSGPTATVATNVSGIATLASWTLGPVAGPNSLTATPTGTGISPPSITFSATAALRPTAATITADTPDPSVVGQPYPVNYTVAATVAGTGSPTGNVTVSDGAATCTGAVAAGTCTLTSTTPGTKTLTVTYAGDGGFATSSGTTAHTVTIATTTTTITGDTPDPSTVNVAYAVTYTVAVVAPGAGTPTGNVTVSDGVATCSGTVAAGTCSLVSTTPGAKTLTATYASDGNFASSSGTTAHTVTAATSTTTITGDTPDPSVTGQAIAVSFTVTGAAPTPTGTVTVTDGVSICSGALTAGAGSCNLTLTTAGAKTLTATYAGDATHSGSASAGAAHTVNAAATTTAITADTPDPSVVGQPVPVSFTVAVTAPGTGTPSGNVTVSDGTVSCTALVAAGTCTLTPSTAGAKTLTATYAGDVNFAPSSGTTAHQVNAAATTTAITGDTPDPSTVNVAYTVSFTVTPTAPGAGTPTGNVTVSDGVATCTATVAVGSCLLTSTTATPKTLTAIYSGDVNFTSSTSPGVAHTVVTAGTSTAITGDAPDPSVTGQPIAVSFSVTGAAPTPIGNVTVSDGVATCTGALNASAIGTCNLIPTTAGAKTLVATYAGDALHGGSISVGVSHTVNAASTTITIPSDNPDPSVVNTAYAVTYTVVVVAPGAGTPTGSVTVSDGAVTCTATVAAGTCSLVSTTSGPKTLTATYAGDGNFAASGSTTTHTVSAATTTTTITADTPDPSVTGQAVAVSFTVTGAAPTPTGNVTVSDGVATCTGALNASAIGTCNLIPTTAGAKTLVATYAGDASHGGSTYAGAAHTVNAAATTTTITGETPDPSVVGQGYVVNYTVAVTAPGAGAPTGNVTVIDATGGTCTGTAAAGNCTLTSTTAGAKTLTATYAGDGNFATSSGTMAHTVNAASTTTTITGDSPDPSAVNTAYPVTYTVVPVAPGAGTPTGNVTVSDGVATCTATVAAGSCSLTSTTTGAKTLTATFAGDGNFATSSGTTAHTVSASGTSTTLTGDSPDPSVTGQPIAVSFTVTGAAPTPTGNVTVSDGVATCTGALNVSATGTCNLSPTTAGVKTLTATYAGDATHSGSTSVGISHTVNAASTTTAITADTPDPSTVNVAYTVSFTVTAAAPGAGAPTGNVTVSDGAATCTATVAVGNCSLTSTTTGPKTLTATYAGDANFASSSGTTPHTVSASATTTTITGDSPDPSVMGQAIAVSFTVTGSAPTPTGNVTVTDGVATCIGALTAGAGSCNLTPTSAGAKTLTATYEGDATHGGSTSVGAAHTVNAATTTTTITADTPDPSVVGQPVPVSYTVAVTAPGAGTPTGNVTVSDGTVSCTATAAAGTCTLTPTTAGAKTLTATYAGDGNFATSSGTTAHQVNAAATTTAITGDTPDPSTVNAVYTVSFTVTATAPGAGTPTGNVTVSDGAATCTATVAVGSCSLTSTTTGAKTLTATYAGSANFATSSGTTAHTVNAISTTTTITGDSPDPSVVGQAIATSFTVTAAPGTPTGNVTVSDGAASCTGALTAGAGSCNLTPTTAGAKTITATYAGDATHGGSTSVGISHTVNAAATTTTISQITPNVTQVGVAINVDFTVAVTAPGSGTPSGNVTATDGTNSCTASVATGTCSFTPATGVPATIQVTATYEGNANFATSTSAAVDHTVN